MANNLGNEMEKAFAEIEAGLARNDDSSSEEDEPTQVPTPPQAITQGPQDLSIQLNVTKSNIPPSPKATTSVPPVRRESPRLRLQRLKEEQKQQKKAAPKKKNKTSPTLPPKASNKTTTTTSNTTTKGKKGKAPKTTKGNGGPGRVRGRNFTEDETWYLLDIISAVEPAGQHDWDRVTEAYNEHFNDPDRMRDRESLKRRFGALHGRKIPTGDPDCPKEVKAAKRILIEIQQRCDVGEKPGKRDLGFDSSSTDESLQDGDADYGEDDDEEEEDNHGEKQDKQDKLETPRTSLSKPLRSATKKRLRHATEKEDGTDAILKYMMVSQQQRQEADEKERAFRREKEDERREREDARAQQAMAMQQSMFQMMMQQQTNMLMLLAPRGQQFQQQQVQPQQLQHELVQPQNSTAKPATHEDHTTTTSDDTNNDKYMEEHED